MGVGKRIGNARIFDRDGNPIEIDLIEIIPVVTEPKKPVQWFEWVNPKRKKYDRKRIYRPINRPS